jgi:hypothetical protein
LRSLVNAHPFCGGFPSINHLPDMHTSIRQGSCPKAADPFALLTCICRRISFVTEISVERRAPKATRFRCIHGRQKRLGFATDHSTCRGHGQQLWQEQRSAVD